MQIKFSKYEGAGNDFIIIDARSQSINLSSEMIVSLCNRHFGVGADGVMTLHDSENYDCLMHYYNADGSQGEMCGNGGRCFTLFAEHLSIGGDTKVFEALDGVHQAQILHTDAISGEIKLGLIDVISIEQGTNFWALNTGVPHYVEFVEDIESVDVCGRGYEIRYDKRFKHGTNVNFVQIVGDGEIKIRTYERGVENETLACGTGATAAAITTNFVAQKQTNKFIVHALGGDLVIDFEHLEETTIYRNIHLSGKARRVFEGVINTDNLESYNQPTLLK